MTQLMHTVTIGSSAPKLLLGTEYGRPQAGFQHVQATDTFLSTSPGFQPRFVCEVRVIAQMNRTQRFKT